MIKTKITATKITRNNVKIAVIFVKTIVQRERERDPWQNFDDVNTRKEGGIKNLTWPIGYPADVPTGFQQGIAITAGILCSANYAVRCE